MCKDIEKNISEILDDIASNIKAYFNIHNIEYCNSNSEDIILSYYKNRNKKITCKPRSVIFSNELNQKINDSNFVDGSNNQINAVESEALKALIIDFKNKFEKGDDINNHLSKGIFSKNTDYLRSYWNIYHLHLNNTDVSVDKRDMGNNRSSWLLFFIIEDSEVYFVDVRFHPTGSEFTDPSFLKIVDEEKWMDKIGFYPVNEKIISNNFNVTKCDEIFELYKEGVNTTFEINGNYYFSINPLMSTQNTFNETIELVNLKKRLREILNTSEYVKVIRDDNGKGKIVFTEGVEVYF